MISDSMRPAGLDEPKSCAQHAARNCPVLEMPYRSAADITCMGSRCLGAIPVHVCQRVAAAPAALLIAWA